MSRTRNAPLLLALVACIFVVAGVMVTAVLVASRRPVVVVIPAGTGAPIAAPAPEGLPTAGASGATPAPPGARPVQVLAVRLSNVPPLDNVFDPAWEKIPAVEVPLQPQQTAAPMLSTATVASVTVQAARDDQRIAWRLSWAASHPATRAESGQFPDAVALQFPMADAAPFTMGAKGMPVRLLHWKALWQKDADEGFQDVNKVYPNAWNDLYWFAPGAAPQTMPASFKTPEAQQYLPAYAAGNSMADFQRKTPVEELVAEGFGTATHVPESPSAARGVWKDGRWTVVIDRPWSTQDPMVARWQSAAHNLISFAVWDGSAANRGGRKHYCTWVPMKVEP